MLSKDRVVYFSCPIAVYRSVLFDNSLVIFVIICSVDVPSDDSHDVL